MPGFDRTGPSGQGSRSGRQMGKCGTRNSASDDTEIQDRPRRRRIGLGNRNPKGNDQGLGRGQRRGFGRTQNNQ